MYSRRFTLGPGGWARAPQGARFTDVDKEGWLDADAQRLLAQGNTLMPLHVRTRSYSVGWGPGIEPAKLPEHATYLRSFVDDVTTDLLASIDAAVAAAGGAPDSVVAEAEAHWRGALRRADTLCEAASVTKVLAAARAYLAPAADAPPSTTGQALVIYGASGAGKSCIMAALAAEPHASDDDKSGDDKSGRSTQVGGGASVDPVGEGGGCVLVRFLGTTPQSSSAPSLIRSLLLQLARIYEREDEAIPHDFQSLTALFKLALLTWPSATRPLVLLLDGVDQLDDAERGRELGWLPLTSLPPAVRVVVSSRSSSSGDTPTDAPEGATCLACLTAALGVAPGASSGMVEVEAVSEPEVLLTQVLARQGRAVSALQLAEVHRALSDARTV